MSQVIVTEDQLKDKRLKSGAQERAIERESGFDQWRRSDVTKADGFKRVVGLGTYPIVALWSVLLGLIYLVVQVFKVAIGAIGKMAWKKQA